MVRLFALHRRARRIRHGPARTDWARRSSKCSARAVPWPSAATSSRSGRTGSGGARATRFTVTYSLDGVIFALVNRRDVRLALAALTAALTTRLK